MKKEKKKNFEEKKPGQKSQLPCTAGGCPVPPGPPLVAAVLISPPALKKR
jgi:hypothetical protein